MKKELGIFVLLIVLCVVVSIINPNFLLAINLQNLARQIGAFGIFSIGLGTRCVCGRRRVPFPASGMMTFMVRSFPRVRSGP